MVSTEQQLAAAGQDAQRIATERLQIMVVVRADDVETVSGFRDPERYPDFAIITRAAADGHLGPDGSVPHAAIQAYPSTAESAPPSKTFWRLNNPWLWAAAIGGLAVVGGGVWYMTRSR